MTLFRNHGEKYDKSGCIKRKGGIMNNQLNKLLDEILSENKCKPNLRKQLVNHLTEETREYYDLLNKRIEHSEKLAPIELKIMHEKINDELKELKITLMVKFENGYTPLPAAVAFIFDKDGMKQKVDEAKSMPGVEYVTGWYNPAQSYTYQSTENQYD